MQTFNLETGEEIIAKKRKHWFEYLLPLAGGIFNALLPLIMLVFLGYWFGDVPLITDFPGNFFYLLMFFYAVWLLIIWLNIAVIVTNIYLDVLIVTNRRLIDIEQRGLFSRRVSSVRFDRIQDITVNVHGIIPTMLHFGNLSIQTAGEQKEFTVKNIGEPYETKDIIMREHHRAVESRMGTPPPQTGGVAL